MFFQCLLFRDLQPHLRRDLADSNARRARGHRISIHGFGKYARETTSLGPVIEMKRRVVFVVVVVVVVVIVVVVVVVVVVVFVVAVVVVVAVAAAVAVVVSLPSSSSSLFLLLKTLCPCSASN